MEDWIQHLKATLFGKTGLSLVSRFLDPENTHRLSIWFLVTFPSFFFDQQISKTDQQILKTRLWGYTFSNPVGLGAGFSKSGEAIPGLFNLGFSFIELGSTTPLPQNGNKRPRVFRLESTQSIVNHYGLPNLGYNQVLRNIIQARQDGQKGFIGVSLAKGESTKTCLDETADFVLGSSIFGRSDLVDFITLNLSCPNVSTPSYCQGQDLANMINQVKSARPTKTVPVLVKLSPDLEETKLKETVQLLVESKIDGLVLTNTSQGVSGQQLANKSLATLKTVYKLTKGTGIVLISAGGISSGKDVYERLANGANLVQIYTALVFQGPYLIPKIKRELADFLRQDGFRLIKND